MRNWIALNLFFHSSQWAILTSQNIIIDLFNWNFDQSNVIADVLQFWLDLTHTNICNETTLGTINAKKELWLVEM